MSQSYSADHSAAFHQMLGKMKAAGQDFVNGDPVPIMELWSTAADVSILGEGGGHDLGWERVGPTLMAGAALFNPGHRAPNGTPSASGRGLPDGSGRGSVEGSGHLGVDIDIIAQGISASGDLAYTVGIERGEAYVLDHDESRVGALRVTTIYRWEASRWKIIHRHADVSIESR